MGPLDARGHVECSIAAYEGITIFKAFNPAGWYTYFVRSPATAWRHMAGAFLAVTGCEALYADLGHFSRPAIQLSSTALVYPCLVLTYLGQVRCCTPP